MSETEWRTGDFGMSERHDFLYYATASAGAVAASATSWPMIDSMNPSAEMVNQLTISVDLAGVAAHARITIKWADKPAFIWRRSTEAVAETRVTPIDDTDENADSSQDMPALHGSRYAEEAGEWLVVIGICTRLGCVSLGRDGSSIGDFGGWFCARHGSHYDRSGRIRRGPAPRIPDIPLHSFGTDRMLTIGA